MKQQIRRILALALVVLALAAIFTGCAKKPGKTLTVDVTHGDGTTKTFTVKTDAENLGAALVEDKEIGEDVVAAVGATWKQSDVFGYELNLARLEQIKSGA